VESAAGATKNGSRPVLWAYGQDKSTSLLSRFVLASMERLLTEEDVVARFYDAERKPMATADTRTGTKVRPTKAERLDRDQKAMCARNAPVAPPPAPAPEVSEVPRDFGLEEAARLLNVSYKTAAKLCGEHECARYSCGPGGKATRSRYTWKITDQDITDIKLEMRKKKRKK
jgi:hypothetical protein